jgi:hypothetical protein
MAFGVTRGPVKFGGHDSVASELATNPSSSMTKNMRMVIASLPYSLGDPFANDATHPAWVNSRKSLLLRNIHRRRTLRKTGHQSNHQNKTVVGR